MGKSKFSAIPSPMGKSLVFFASQWLIARVHVYD